ncbi:uncharacterized protein LOC142047532 [Chelonoidis abingdonii]|uniref:uncharacterized protein LOC142047532 n=1 Tax=Chelonoidis abingdonii TaxID=106734 RepID=UPI003F4907A3
MPPEVILFDRSDPHPLNRGNLNSTDYLHLANAKSGQLEVCADGIFPSSAGGFALLIYPCPKQHSSSNTIHLSCNVIIIILFILTITTTKPVSSCVHLIWKCSAGHIVFEWSSQPLVKGQTHAGDLALSAAIILSGNNFGKISQMANFMKLTFISKLLAIETVDECKMQLNFPFMEKEAFRRGLQKLLDEQLMVKEVVTDSHTQISALITKKFPCIIHSYDIWGDAKNLENKLIEASRQKHCCCLLQWGSDIVNYFWFCCKEANSYEEFIGMWCGLVCHVVSEHRWAHGNSIIEGQCKHGPH